MTHHQRHSSFSNRSAALPTSQLILQHFRCFTNIIGTSPTSPGEPPMPLWWCLIYPWWYFNLQWLRPAGLYERHKMALELKRLKTPALNFSLVLYMQLIQWRSWTGFSCVKYYARSGYLPLTLILILCSSLCKPLLSYRILYTEWSNIFGLSSKSIWIGWRN